MLPIDLVALVWQPLMHSSNVLSAVLSLCCGLDDKQIAFAHICQMFRETDSNNLLYDFGHKTQV